MDRHTQAEGDEDAAEGTHVPALLPGMDSGEIIPRILEESGIRHYEDFENAPLEIQDAPHELRFGDRLRHFAHHEQGFAFVREACDGIADAIDRDREEERKDLRRKVEEAVERFRYAPPWAPLTRCLLDPYAFKAELDRIFETGGAPTAGDEP